MERIFVVASPVAPKQAIHIFSDNLPKIPLTKACEFDKIAELVTGYVQKYNINDIAIAGPTDYTEKIKDNIITSLTAKFEKIDKFTVQLM